MKLGAAVGNEVKSLGDDVLSFMPLMPPIFGKEMIFGFNIALLESCVAKMSFIRMKNRDVTLVWRAA